MINIHLCDSSSLLIVINIHQRVADCLGYVDNVAM